MDRSTLTHLFRVNLYTVRTNTEGVTHEDSLVAPDPGGSPLNWVLGHMVTARELVLATLGQASVLTEEEQRVYARGSTFDAEAALPFSRLQKALVHAQRGIDAGLEAVSDEVMAQPIPEGETYPPGFETVADKLAFLHFHEAYHCGQIALLRRLSGREGRIT